ncbi:hypothetical protein [Vibrio phage R01]|nr:hypothetical protein [Vibrio phage R01]
MEITSRMYVSDTPCKRGHDPVRYKRTNACVFCARIRNRYRNMIGRCHDPKHHKYEDYGARGITVCQRWRESFEDWYEDIGQHLVGTDLSMDRKNNDEGYYPGNVRIATPGMQNRNQRRSVLITYDGITKNAADWATELGVKPHTLSSGFKRGVPVEELLFNVKVCEVSRGHIEIQRGGRRMCLAAWCRLLKYSIRTVEDRVYKFGWSYAQALGFAPRKGKLRPPPTKRD